MRCCTHTTAGSGMPCPPCRTSRTRGAKGLHLHTIHTSDRHARTHATARACLSTRAYTHAALLHGCRGGTAWRAGLGCQACVPCDDATQTPRAARIGVPPPFPELRHRLQITRPDWIHLFISWDVLLWHAYHYPNRCAARWEASRRRCSRHAIRRASGVAFALPLFWRGAGDGRNEGVTSVPLTGAAAWRDAMAGMGALSTARSTYWAITLLPVRVPCRALFSRTCLRYLVRL